MYAEGNIYNVSGLSILAAVFNFLEGYIANSYLLGSSLVSNFLFINLLPPWMCKKGVVYFYYKNPKNDVFYGEKPDLSDYTFRTIPIYANSCCPWPLYDVLLADRSFLGKKSRGNFPRLILILLRLDLG